MSNDDMYFSSKPYGPLIKGQQTMEPLPARPPRIFRLIFLALLGMLVGGVLFAVAAIIMAVVGYAQDQDTLWVRENLLTECKRRGTCWRYLHPHRYDWWGTTYYYRPFYYRQRWDYDRDNDSWRYRRYDREDYADDYRFSGRCRPVAIATGHEAYNRDVAREEGEQAWMEEVRSKWGARYMDLRNAHEVSYECYRSSTGNRLSEKTSDLAGKVLEQCRVEARPCRAEKEYVADQSPALDSRNLKSDDKRGSRLWRSFEAWKARRAIERDRRRR